MPTILVTFANSSINPLPTLQQEYEGVADVLRDVIKTGAFKVVINPIATRDQVAKDIRVHEEDICLFSFSGHAGRDRLALEDGVGQADGIAALLGHCPNLKVVLLNGCSTGGQVRTLLEKKVPVVIATSAPVGDEKATRFAIAFFTELFQRKQSIQAAFTRGVDAAQFYGSTGEVSHKTRNMMDIEADENPVWGIFYLPEQEVMLAKPFETVIVPTVAKREEIKKLVAGNRIKEAIEKLKAEEVLVQDATMLSASFAKLERDERLSLISFDNARIQRAQIINAVLELSTQIE